MSMLHCNHNVLYSLARGVAMYTQKAFAYIVGPKLWDTLLMDSRCYVFKTFNPILTEFVMMLVSLFDDLSSICQ